MAKRGQKQKRIAQYALAAYKTKQQSGNALTACGSTGTRRHSQHGACPSLAAINESDSGDGDFIILCHPLAMSSHLRSRSPASLPRSPEFAVRLHYGALPSDFHGNSLGDTIVALSGLWMAHSLMSAASNGTIRSVWLG